MDNVKYVVDNSNYVKIHEEIIPNIINMVKSYNYEHWSDSNKIFKKLTEKELILFSFILESLNFCFWSSYDWKVTYDNNQYIGSDALLYTLLKAIEKGNLKLDIDDLCNITEEKFIEIMQEKEIVPKLMNERYNSLVITIKAIKNHKYFWDELFSIKSAEELESYIVNIFPNFKDEVTYKNKLIIFNKRCRLLISDLYYVSKTIKKNLKNIDHTKGCADYSLPRYFHEMNLFEYKEPLLSKIKNEEEITYGSEFEVEIRAATIYVLEIIKEELKKKNINVNSVELDNILWRISRQNRQTKPHHTTSIYY